MFVLNVVKKVIQLTNAIKIIKKGIKAIIDGLNEINLSTSESDNESKILEQTSESESENNLINKIMDQFYVGKTKECEDNPNCNCNICMIRLYEDSDGYEDVNLDDSDSPPSINVLSEKDQITLDTIMQIENTEKQKQMMSRILELNNKPEKPIQTSQKPIQMINLNNIFKNLSKFDEPKPVNIKDLQQLVHQLNNEIKELKKEINQHKMRLEILELNANIRVTDRT